MCNLGKRHLTTARKNSKSSNVAPYIYISTAMSSDTIIREVPEELHRAIVLEGRECSTGRIHSHHAVIHARQPGRGGSSSVWVPPRLHRAIVHTESSSPERSGDDTSDALHNIRAAPEEPIVHTESSSAEQSGDDASDAYSGPAADSVAQAEITAYPTYVNEFFSGMTFPHGRLGHNVTLSFETHEQLLRNSSKPYEGPKNANVFIFHLPSDFDNFTLYLLFRKFGDLISARVMVNLHTGASRGYGRCMYLCVCMNNFM